ncbi:MAG: sodium/proline symporter [Ruminococcaceae bacterium]|nr:sodium/proline symporter [Oscillospiraceae bacterium]
MNFDIQYLISIVLYMAAVIAIGAYCAKRANKNAEAYFLGGRTLGPWVSAMSAEASDMSGWLLMGLPGLAYWSGLASAGWTAIGLALGTYLNWLITSKRLRRYSERIGAITIPDFFSKRFHEKSNVLLIIASVLIIVFFTPYAGSCLMACGKLFAQLFNADYTTMVIIAAVFVLAYTFLGGFLGESASDFMQAIVMVIALICVLTIGVVQAGGLGAVLENSKDIPGFISLFESANPTEVVDGAVVYGDPQPVGFVTILSGLVWGLGYFGMPQVLLRFMAIRSEKELTLSRRVATVWVLISLSAAIFIGVIGRMLYPTQYVAQGEAENIFILLTTNMLPALLAGLICAGILAASISSSDSYLLISASAIAENVYHGVFKKNATDKQVMLVTRIILVLIMIFAMVVATSGNDVIFTIVDFAWAGLGATFGPLMIFSLFWKRTNYQGAVAGMITGGVVAIVWNFFISKLGGIFAVYELAPAFLLSSIAIVVVSLLTAEPSKEIQDDFDYVVSGK